MSKKNFMVLKKRTKVLSDGSVFSTKINYTLKKRIKSLSKDYLTFKPNQKPSLTLKTTEVNHFKDYYLSQIRKHPSRDRKK